jgi:predicted amino acid dehydrogenase
MQSQTTQLLLLTVEKEMELALFKIKLSEPVLQRKILIKLRNEISNQLNSFLMPEERKNYLLHQLVNAQDIDSLVELIASINQLQISQNAQDAQDLIFLAQTSQGIIITKKSFSPDATSESNTKLLKTLRSLPEEQTAAVIGTTGEIMTEAATTTAGEVDHLILLHHSPLDVSIKLQKVLTQIFQKIVDLPAHSEVSRAVKRHWHQGASVVSFLEIPDIKNVITTTTDLNMVYEADIILYGNCPTSSFLKHNQFKPNAVLINMTSSQTISEHLGLMTSKRPDLTVFFHTEHN